MGIFACYLGQNNNFNTINYEKIIDYAGAWGSGICWL